MTTKIKSFLTDQSLNIFSRYLILQFPILMKNKYYIKGFLTKILFSLFLSFPDSDGFHSKERECPLQSKQVNIYCCLHFDGFHFICFHCWKC